MNKIIKKTCRYCSYFKYRFHIIAAPIRSINADGNCKNENNKAQPTIINCNVDTCNNFNQIKKEENNAE